MKNLDFAFQTFVIALTLVFVLAGIFRDGEITLLPLICAQLFIGPWQFFGSSIRYAKYRKHPSSQYKTLLSVHFITSTLYLLITFLLMDFVSNNFFQIWIMIIPWVLALYYYVLSYLKVKGYRKYHRHKGGFLPHLKL